MAVNPPTVVSELGNGAMTSGQLLAKVKTFYAKFGRVVKTRSKSSLRSLQTARLTSALSNMSDSQLTQIGIKRSEIPNYATKLMEKE